MTPRVSPATKSKRRVLGIDPGLARLGWAIVGSTSKQPELIGCGCLETSAKAPTERRLLELYRRLHDIIREYHPTEVAIEKIFFTKNVTTGIVVSQARGIVLLAAAERDLPISEFTPTAVKATICGDGRADKRQMGRMIQLLLRLQRLPKHDDTADAIAIALCAASTNMIH